MKRFKKTRQVISGTLLAFNFALLGSAFMGYQVVANEPETETVMKEVQKQVEADDYSFDNRVKQATYDKDVDFATGAEVAEARKHFESTIEEFGIGSIYMPKANISVPLLAGTSEWNLFNGVGTGRPDQRLGEGLFIGLSHNLVNDRLLKHIDKMETGDLVYVTDFEDVYVYKTSVQEVVHETDHTYMREPDETENPKMLIYRCEGESGTEWRRVVYSDYQETIPIDEVDEDILAGLQIDVAIEQEKEREEKEKEMKEVKGYVEVEQEVEKEQTKTKKALSPVFNWLNEHDSLQNFFLDVYRIANESPTKFFALVGGIFILTLFI